MTGLHRNPDPTADLPELLMHTALDAFQAAHLTGLPLALCQGCADVLHGEPARSADPLYVRGQRLADAWFYATLATE
jgi:hypothetical protein